VSIPPSPHSRGFFTILAFENMRESASEGKHILFFYAEKSVVLQPFYPLKTFQVTKDERIHQIRKLWGGE